MTEQEPSHRTVDAAEGDYLEQQLPANPAEDTDPDPEANESDPAAGIQDVEANEADVLEQRREVPDDDEYENSASSGAESGY